MFVCTSFSLILVLFLLFWGKFLGIAIRWSECSPREGSNSFYLFKNDPHNLIYFSLMHSNCTKRAPSLFSIRRARSRSHFPHSYEFYHRIISDPAANSSDIFDPNWFPPDILSDPCLQEILNMSDPSCLYALRFCSFSSCSFSFEVNSLSLPYDKVCLHRGKDDLTIHLSNKCELLWTCD